MSSRRLDSAEIRHQRLREPVDAGLLVFAPLWPKNDTNLGTLARTADALNASMVTVKRDWGRKAVRRANTIGVHNTHVSYVLDTKAWLTAQANTCRIVAVEIASGSITLRDLEPAATRSVIVLGHETGGVPNWALELADVVVEIPMFGVGNSLNVATAGALVGYKLAGLL